MKFYGEYIPNNKFPGLVNHACFGSTYICGQLFSKMNFAKCKTRTQLSDAHLDGTLRLASTQLQRDIQHNIGH